MPVSRNPVHEKRKTLAGVRTIVAVRVYMPLPISDKID